MLRMSRIANGGEEILVASWATTVLRRSVPLAFKTPWSFAARIACNDLLDERFVFPVVAEVVHVCEALDASTHNVCQDHRSFIDYRFVEVVRLSIRSATNEELVEVAIRPAKDRLDHIVEYREPNGPWHLHSTPDRRMDTFQGDPHLKDPPTNCLARFHFHLQVQQALDRLRKLPADLNQNPNRL